MAGDAPDTSFDGGGKVVRNVDPSSLRKLGIACLLLLLTVSSLPSPSRVEASAIYAEYFVQYLYSDPWYTDQVGVCVRNDCTMYYNCTGQWGPYEQIYRYQICCNC